MSHGLIDLLLEAPNQLMVNEVVRLVEIDNQPNQILVVNPNIPHTKLDDSTSIPLLEQIGNDTFTSRASEIQEFFSFNSRLTQ
jgi:hypothetical protein